MGAVSPRTAGADGVQIAGDVLKYAVPGVGLGMVAWNHDLQGFRDWTESGLVTIGTTWTLKLTVPAKRPDGHSRSFPSGHTSTAAWGAGFIHRRYGWMPAIPAYVATGFVAWSRVNADRHHPRDVLVGALIGFASSYLFTKPLEGDAPLGTTFQFMPIVDDRQYGFVVSGRF
jgi:membrane-associated phospholipid phosphatase